MNLSDKSALPVGLGMSLALDVDAMTNFVSLSNDEKERLIDYVKSSGTGDEAKNRVNEVVSSLKGKDSFF